MAWDWLVQLLIYIAISIAVYILMPKPDMASVSGATDELEAPTAEAGRAIAVQFGTVTVKSLNTLAVKEKSRREYEVDAGGGKK